MPFAETRIRNEAGQFIEKEKILKECPMCHIFFLMYPSDDIRGRRFCSSKCAYKWKSIHYVGKKHWRYKSKKSICKQCERTFEHKPAQDRQFCSKRCSNLFRDYNQNGSNNPNWKGGITPIIRALRTSKDYAIWREAVFKRDNYTCQNCSKNKELQVHHIIPLSHNIKLAFDISNGITLCINCHQEEHPELKLTLQGGYDYAF